MSMRHLIISMIALAMFAVLFLLSPPSTVLPVPINSSRRSLTIEPAAPHKANGNSRKSFHIFQASPPHTASTVVNNWLIGLFEPDADYSFMINDAQRRIRRNGKNISINNGHIVTKTHVKDLSSLYKQYQAQFGEIFFVASNRGSDPRTRIDDSLCQHTNVLCLEYQEVLFSNHREMKAMVKSLTDRFQDKFGYFFDEADEDFFGVDSQANAVRRLGDMMMAIDEMADEPFEVSDRTFGVHGGHRQRDGSELKGGITSTAHL